MKPTTKPPLGVMPYREFRRLYPEPTLNDLLWRYSQVIAAVYRYRKAGMEVPCQWPCELFGIILYGGSDPCAPSASP